jgi:hypothetical protein
LQTKLLPTRIPTDVETAAAVAAASKSVPRLRAEAQSAAAEPVSEPYTVPAAHIPGIHVMVTRIYIIASLRGAVHCGPPCIGAGAALRCPMSCPHPLIGCRVGRDGPTGRRCTCMCVAPAGHHPSSTPSPGSPSASAGFATTAGPPHWAASIQ